MVSWSVFFHREAHLAPGVAGDELVLRHARVLERASARLRVGQPFLVGPDGTVDVRVNRWLVSDEIRGLSRSTWEKYAYSLKVWLSFLSAYGCRWDEADHGAQEAFKVWRVQDERNPRLVSLGTYDHDLIAIRLFYGWASAEYGVHNPIRMRRGRGRRRRDGSPVERAVTAPKATRDRDVKWFDPDGFARYRDVGLQGLTVDGEDDPGFRGRNGQRDGAFIDGLYGTGLRLQEWASVLLVELPADDATRAYYTCHVADATAKGGYGRDHWMPRQALLQALNYVEGERAAAVRRARREGRYERLPGARIIVQTLAGRRLRLRSRDGRLSDVPLDALDSTARLRLFRETAEGLEPAALWLNEDGSARARRGWHHTFTAANQRLARLGFVGFAGAAHMMRHSFALRWYSVGKLVYRAQLGHLTEEETRDFRQQFGDVWGLVQLLLGHQDVQTTKDTYLEPFQSLALEMLLLHAADAAIPQLMAELLRCHPRVLHDPVREAR